MVKKGRRTRRRAGGRVDSLVLPLAFTCKEGEERVTTIHSIQETFDRARPFRIAAIWGRLASYGTHSCLFQWELYGPISTSDNTFVAPMTLAVPNGTRFRYSIPVTKTGWYPSDTAISTYLMKLKAVCIDKTKDTGLIGVCNVRVLMQPREVDGTCPTLTMLPPTPSCSGVSSSSVSIIEEDSDSDEYFSC